jgi:hypothetical protein
MPDEIATRATLLLMGGIVAGLALAPLAAWLWRLATRARSGSSFGLAAGLALFGAAMAWVVADMATVVLARSGQLTVQGRLEGFDSVTLRESARGQKLKGAAPRVSFRLPDGARHEVLGLSGSLQDLEPGDRVPVRVDPRDPAGAVIADFQNLHGALALFGTFAVVALLSAVHGTALAVVELRQARAATGQRRPPARASRFAVWRDGAAGQHWRRTVKRVALATLVLGIVAMFVLAESMDVGRAIAITLAAVAVSLLGFGVAAALAPGARPVLSFGGWCIGAIGVGMFAAMLWLLTGPTPF